MRLSRGEDTLGTNLRRDFAAAGARSTRTTIVLETLLERPGPLIDDEPSRGGGERDDGAG